jgi:hypothetical protein
LVSALFICPKELWFDLPAVEIFWILIQNILSYFN